MNTEKNLLTLFVYQKSNINWFVCSSLEEAGIELTHKWINKYGETLVKEDDYPKAMLIIKDILFRNINL